MQYEVINSYKDVLGTFPDRDLAEEFVKTLRKLAVKNKLDLMYKENTQDLCEPSAYKELCNSRYDNQLLFFAEQYHNVMNEQYEIIERKTYGVYFEFAKNPNDSAFTMHVIDQTGDHIFEDEELYYAANDTEEYLLAVAEKYPEYKMYILSEWDIFFKRLKSAIHLIEEE